MKWLVFSYSLPSKLGTASRVRIWRKLRKSGAISPKAGVHILPHTDECMDAIRWLTAEVEQESGEVIVMQVDRFENLSDDKVIDIFRKERSEDYQQIEVLIAELEQLIEAEHVARNAQPEKVVSIKRDIGKLKKNIDEVSKVDFFPVNDKRNLLDRLHHLHKTLITGNLILLIFCSLGTFNTVVLRKMKEEQVEVSRKETVKLKRPQFKVAQFL